MIYKTEVIEKFKELQGIIEKESQKENGLYNGLIDGVVSEYIEDLEIEYEIRTGEKGDYPTRIYYPTEEDEGEKRHTLKELMERDKK